MIIFLNAFKASVKAFFKNLKIVLLILVKVVFLLSFAICDRDLLPAFSSWTVAGHLQAGRAKSGSIGKRSDLIGIRSPTVLVLNKILNRLIILGVLRFPFNFKVCVDAVYPIAGFFTLSMVQSVR